VLHATRWKNESKYRARGAGGPDKIKQLFPRFIGSAVNRRSHPPPTPPPASLPFKMHSSRVRLHARAISAIAARANELRFAQAVETEL